MIQYHSNASFPAPQLEQASQQALAAQSPYAGQNHQDIFRAQMQAGAMDLDRYARQQQDKYATAANEAKRGLALSGLTMMGQGQSSQQQLANSRLQALLRGLL